MKSMLSFAALLALGACNTEPATVPATTDMDTAVLPVDNTMAMGNTMTAGGVTVTVTGVTPNSGPVLVALQNEGDFAKTSGEYTQVVQPTAASVTATFAGVPAGRYAAAVVQDTNNDGTLTLGATGPTEPYGFSGAPQPGAAPTFGPAAFDVTATGGTASVQLSGQ